MKHRIGVTAIGASFQICKVSVCQEGNYTGHVFWNMMMCKILRTALFWFITQRVVVTPYQRFGTTYRSSLQGSRILDP